MPAQAHYGRYILLGLGFVWLLAGVAIAWFYLGWLVRGIALDIWDTAMVALRLKLRRSVGRPAWRWIRR
jgi:hypothetical protein